MGIDDDWDKLMGGSGIGASPFLIPAATEGLTNEQVNQMQMAAQSQAYMNSARVHAMMNQAGIDPAAQQQLLTQQEILAQQVNAHQFGSQPPPSESKWEKLTKQNRRARDLLLMRMGGVDGVTRITPADFVHCQCYGDKVYLFYLFSGKEGVVTEDINIFPSDTLVAQMRLIVNA